MNNARMRIEGEGGFSLIETVLAAAVVGVVISAVQAMLHWSMVSQVRARETLRASRIAQTIHSRLNSISFYAVQDYDSSNPPTGGDWEYPIPSPASTTQYLDPTTSYPESATMNELQQMVTTAGFTHFSIKVTHMRRVKSGMLISDLDEFSDGPDAGKCDDDDPTICYTDTDGDGDFNDAFFNIAADRIITEAPDTHLKRVDITIWRRDQSIAIKQGELISLEQFRGSDSLSSESPLTLDLDSPASVSYVYSELTVAQQNAQALPINYSFAAKDPPAYKKNMLTAKGVTAPNAEVQFFLEGVAKDIFNGDIYGDFSGSFSTLSAGLVLGQNLVSARAKKGAYYSPYARMRMVYDTQIPIIEKSTPLAAQTMKTLSPYVACVLRDDTSSTSTVSGIWERSISFIVNGSTVPHQYDKATGRLAFIDQDTLAPAKLPNNTVFNIKVEGADLARYKVNLSWSFSTAADLSDATDPICDLVVGSGSSLDPIQGRCLDDESGIDPSTLSMTIKYLGSTIADISHKPPSDPIGSYYDGLTGALAFRPSAPLAAGSYEVTIHGQNWATAPKAATVTKIYMVNP